MKELYLFGASGHAKVLIEIAESTNWKVTGLVDDNADLKSLLNIQIHNKFKAKDKYWIISIGNNTIRKKIVEQFGLKEYTKLIHPKSSLSSSVNIDIGSVVMAGVSINSESKIGKHCIINTNASIDHDCKIEEFVHISPNVGIAGNVKIGEGTHIGIGANIIQGIKVGKWCTIGAGAVIIRDVPDGATVVGNPGKIIKSTIGGVDENK
ncbi:acetyltransferase [Brumimicrobium salinarum]|uniref:Acetyltransferase n=1 Tax=Brumimicrobium salinarum TaxID=2058658 RepID=A0A2I0R137_9FLAO|nr:acetyltransferase [Brumimicrobium salinarum]PKR80293.1 acetyltransferase [Brumimicrobium salinarum]